MKKTLSQGRQGKFIVRYMLRTDAMLFNNPPMHESIYYNSYPAHHHYYDCVHNKDLFCSIALVEVNHGKETIIHEIKPQQP